MVAAANKGDWDPTGGSFPSGSVTAVGDYFTVTADGTVDGQDFFVDDFLVAETASPSSTTFSPDWSVQPFATSGAPVSTDGLVDQLDALASSKQDTLPTTGTTGDILTWNGSAWVEGTPYYRYIIWAEENANLNAGTNGEFSFGNGATGPQIGLPVPQDCELVGMIFNAETVGTSASISMRINNMNNTTYQIIATTQDATIEFVTPLALSAGDRINFSTTALTGTWTDVRVGAVIRAPLEIL